METVKEHLEFLVSNTDQTEAEVITKAIRSGLHQLWRERILADFVNGKLTREAAIKSVGIDWVELTERQHAAMVEDIEWALGK